MKKIIAMVLIISVLLTIGIMGVNASEIEDTLKEAFWHRTASEGWEDKEYSPEYINLVDYKEYEDIVVFSAINNTLETMPLAYTVEMLDEWLIFNPGYHAYGDGLCLTVYDRDDGTMYDIVTAWEQGLFKDFDEIRHFEQPIAINKLGDTNFDGSINIKDATMIQKYIAGLVSNADMMENYNRDYESFVYLVCNFDGVNDINIKDATAIQKYIAGLE